MARMSETPTGPVPAADNIPVFTVSEISQAVKRTLEGAFDRVRVRGEVSKPNYHGSGHLYFTLKDEDAVIDGVCWRGTVGRLRLTLEHGMEVIATGKISSYSGSSKYQIVVESIELAGEGALLKLLEERRRRLAAEGLFDAARKKPIPLLPDVIGVVTSPTGAVIRDILHRLADRCPRHVLLWPVAVQGEGAAAQIAAAIRGFNAIAPGGPVPRPDLIIVARGGGSLEDLWAFNEEEVVRAAAASDIPLISGVGHETDVTLIDFAADRRAPTPTAAAEMAVPVRAELLARLIETEHRLVGALGRLIAERRLAVEGLGRGLPDPARLLGEKAQRLDGWVERLLNARLPFFDARRRLLARLGAEIPTPHQQIARRRLELGHAAGNLGKAIVGLLARIELRLDSLGRLLDSYSYEQVLARGFALVRDAADRPVISAKAVAPGDGLTIQFADGAVGAVAVDGGGPKAKRPRTGAPTTKAKQGSLW